MSATFTDQPSLFGSGTAVTPASLSKQEAWDAYRRRNPWFMRRFCELAFEDRSRGNKRGSAKKYFEQLRGEQDHRGQHYEPNNDWTALASRLAMELHVDLDGFFETRVRKSH